MNKNIIAFILVSAFLLALVYAAPVFNAERVDRDIELRTDQKDKLEELGYDNYSYDDDTQPDYWVRYLKSTNGLPMPHSPPIRTYTEEDILWNETFVLMNGTFGYNVISDLDNKAIKIYGGENVSYSSIEVIETEKRYYTSDEMVAKLDKWEISVVGNYADVSISRANATASNISRTGDVSVGGGR